MDIITDWGEDEALEKYLNARQAVRYINTWSEKVLGRTIPVTCVKDFAMIWLMDDRLIQVIPNTGERVDGVTLEEMIENLC